jgi:AraC-like DNA-binding protein/ligand-binding sensor protein
MKGNSKLIQSLSEAQIFRDYERAFSEATGLPVSLQGIGTWQVPHRGKKKENPFCAEMASRSRSCASCLTLQEKLANSARDGARTEVCDMGMSDTSVPVKVGTEVIGFLQTGQVFCKKPTANQFAQVAKKLSDWGLPVTKEIEENYFKTRVMTQAQYQSMVQLLTIFAQHLSILSNQLLVQRENAEPPMIKRAKAFIATNQADDLALSTVAKAVNTSTFYFCKMFKKATGLNFTEYLSRVRIEKAKNLLLNPNLRISEIAYAVGFQSLTHFNRVFKRIAGQSPSEYRSTLRGAY